MSVEYPFQNVDTLVGVIHFEKLKSLKLPTFIHGWILNFLTDRKQSTMFNGELSLSSIITRSIVQGSGVGPSLFLIYIADIVMRVDLKARPHKVSTR